MKHGVGIVDHIEDRIVGLKVRDIYEVPAAAILLPAHAELERLVGTIHQNRFKPSLDQQWAYLVYAGLWWEPLRTDIDAYINEVNRQVTGTIGLKLYKGMARVVTRESPNAVYDASLATFNESGGLFSPAGVAGLHRAVVAAVAAGLASAQRGARVDQARYGLQDPRLRRLARRQVVPEEPLRRAGLAQGAGGGRRRRGVSAVLAVRGSRGGRKRAVVVRGRTRPDGGLVSRPDVPASLRERQRRRP